MTAGGRFCHQCGAPASGAAASAVQLPSRSKIPQAWTMAAGVVIVLIAFVAGQQLANAPPDVDPAAAATPMAPFAGTAGRAATDITNMSPEEAASRLFDRVMRYANEGKADSANMFAPMAILAYERIGPLDAHARYDIGTVSVVVGDAAASGAQADTILKAQPNHLLGLILAAKAADLRKDASGAAKFRARFGTAAAAERAKGLKEYVDHQDEIETALGKPRSTSKP